MANRTLGNWTTELERAESENMSGVFSAELSCDQGDSVEIDGTAIAEDLGELGDQVRGTGEATNVDQRSEDHPNTTEATRQAQDENSAVGHPAKPSFL
jgi:hypothetical protein